MRAITAFPDLKQHTDRSFLTVLPSVMELASELSVVAAEAALQAGSGGDAQLNKDLVYLKVWRKSCSRATFAGVLQDASDPRLPPVPVCGPAAAEALRLHWAGVFSATARAPQVEERLLRHIPENRLGDAIRPQSGFSSEFIYHRRNSAPGLDGLR